MLGTNIRGREKSVTLQMHNDLHGSGKGHSSMAASREEVVEKIEIPRPHQGYARFRMFQRKVDEFEALDRR